MHLGGHRDTSQVLYDCRIVDRSVSVWGPLIGATSELKAPYILAPHPISSRDARFMARRGSAQGVILSQVRRFPEAFFLITAESALLAK